MQADALSAYLNYGVTSLILLESKHPIEKDWVQWADKLPDQDRVNQIAQHSGNIGWAIPKGVIVLDCDTQQDADTMKKWLDDSQLLYWHQQTAKGAHYVLRHSLSRSVGNAVRGMFGNVNLDVRVHGGQIVVWPSIHKTGVSYRWIISPWDRGFDQLSELPDNFFQELKKEEVPHETSQTPQTIPMGQRNQTMFKMLSSMRSRGFGDDAIAESANRHNESYCKPPLPAGEISLIVQQVLRYDAGSQKPFTVSKNMAERPPIHDALGRLNRYIQLANQIKRYGQTREHALDILHSGSGGDEENVLEAIRLVFGDSDEASQKIQVYSPSTSLSEYRDRLMKRGQIQQPELPTGFPKMDQLLWGVRRGEIITIGARPGVGKTSWIIGATHHLCSLGKKVLYISTETTFDGIFNRVVAVGADIPTFNLESGQLTLEDKQKFEHYMTVFQAHNLLVCDMSEPSLDTVRRALDQHKPDVLVIDHVQHITTATDNRYGELSRFVKGLKNIARETQCAVLLASQLNRLAAGEIPTLAHLKECGTIEEESHAVLLLYKPQENPGAIEDQVIGILAKNRGPKGHVIFSFYKPSTRFTER